MERVIHPTAKVGSDVRVGFYTVILEDVEIGDNVIIGHHVVIHAGTKIGSNIRIDDHAVIGKQPMKALTSATSDDSVQPPCILHDGCIVGTGAVVYAGCEIGESCLIADLATVRENVTIGKKTIVGRGAAVENYCTIGEFCKLETNAYITAYSTLEDRVFVAPGVVTSNDNFVGRTLERFKHFKGVTVKKGGRIGANATTLPGVTIAEDTLVAAGSVVTHDTIAKKVYLGVPAREVRDVKEEQLLENQ